MTTRQERPGAWDGKRETRRGVPPRADAPVRRTWTRRAARGVGAAVLMSVVAVGFAENAVAVNPGLDQVTDHFQGMDRLVHFVRDGQYHGGKSHHPGQPGTPGKPGKPGKAGTPGKPGRSGKPAPTATATRHQTPPEHPH